MEQKSKFKFSKGPKPKEELKAKENFTIDELKSYYAEFMEMHNKIEEKIKNSKSEIESIIKEDDSNKHNLVEEINSSIKLLKEYYKNNASFLVGYDKQNYLNLLDNLNDEYNNIKNMMFPRKKFAFSSKEKQNKIKKENVEVNSQCEESKTFITDAYDINIKDLHFQERGRHIVREEENKGKNNLIIENVSNCDIIVLIALKAAYIKNVKECNLYIISVEGGSHITECIDSKFYIKTHQLRIHKAFKCDFYINVSSNPIIEDCSSLVFSPLKIKYISMNYEELTDSKNKWNSVLDFKWHKKDKSPNFELIDESKLVTIDI